MSQQSSAPLGRKDLQQQTRERLIFTARAVFSEDGYHGARLDRIAAEAGYSKGAVYSNFAGKAELFLAVMDDNIRASLAGTEVKAESSLASLGDADAVSEAAIRGFALATLEFVAMAARDDDLRAECSKRMDLAIEGYAAMAASLGAAREDLTPAEKGALFFALDQGAAVISLAGSASLSENTLNKGLAAILGLPAGEGSLDPALHHDEVRKNIAANLTSGEPEAPDSP